MYARDYRKYAWNILSGHWGFAILVFVLYTALSAISASFAGVGQLIVYGPLLVGMNGMYLGLVHRHESSYDRLFDGFTNGFANNFFAGLLVGLFTFLWSMLFIIPGIIKSLSYSMTFYILKDHPEMSAMDAIEASKRMMRGRKWNLFCLQFSFIGWYILCLLTGGILTLWISPYVSTATAVFYESIKSELN
jgi:uncharacterized membrane protein